MIKIIIVLILNNIRYMRKQYAGMHMLYAAPSQNLAQHLMNKPTSKMVLHQRSEIKYIQLIKVSVLSHSV